MDSNQDQIYVLHTLEDFWIQKYHNTDTVCEMIQPCIQEKETNFPGHTLPPETDIFLI
jgi:hypothetical protein